MDDSIIKLHNICKKYKDFVLDDISFEVKPGNVMGLVGVNGAGKSTLYRIISGAIQQDFGNITILGIDNKSKEFYRIKEYIGIVLDSVGFPKYLTATSLEIIMQATYLNWDHNFYWSMIEKLDIPAKKTFDILSKGNKMKLGMCVALSHHPKLLLLDEATSGIDIMMRQQIINVIIDYKKEGGTVLVSSHVMSDLQKICDSYLFLHNGKLLLNMSVNELENIKGETLEEKYINTIRGYNL